MDYIVCMNYVAIDFETANSDFNSACSIGLSRFDEEGRQRDSYYTLIRPPVMYFSQGNINVHGIMPSDCRWEKTFDERYDEIMSFIGSDPLVAHNAQFDMNVLRKSAEYYGIKLPHLDYYCTLALARRFLPQFKSHRLGVLVSDYLNMEYDAHLASSDAYVCGLLFSRLLSGRLYDKNTLDHYLKLKGLSYPKQL